MFAALDWFVDDDIPVPEPVRRTAGVLYGLAIRTRRVGQNS